jgi:hypothetical protein
VFDANGEIYEGFGAPRDCGCGKSTVHESDIGDDISAADLFDLKTGRKK